MRDCPVPPAPHDQPRKGGQGGKGGKDGKGKNGKGGKGAKARAGWQVCKHYASTGRCPFADRNGWCRFAHVRLPSALGELQGMVFEDIAEYARYDPATNTYTVPESAVAALSGLGERITAELGEINAEPEASVPTLGDFVDKHVQFAVDCCDGSDF